MPALNLTDSVHTVNLGFSVVTVFSSNVYHKYKSLFRVSLDAGCLIKGLRLSALMQEKEVLGFVAKPGF